eukprot:XP_001695455.1 predicted protein [Chlamydomonas reinhardtii]
MATTLQHYAASVYGTEEAADCRLRFYVSQAHTEQEQSGQADPGAGSSGTATAAQLQQPSRTFVGEPLPAHSLILRGTSFRLRALLSRWTGESAQPWSGGSLPELHVLLDAAEDLGPASEVVRFCYTGQLTELDFHALLLVQRQASYLQVPTCAAACDTALEAKAKSLLKQTKPEQILACLSDHSLFPDPGLEPGFRPVQQALTSALLAHFGCAFSIMSSWARLQQWMQLPEVAVAWALASEELQTDEESSVLLLVLWWLHWQQHEAGVLGWEEAGAAGRRLMQHVRLGCLSRPFLLVLLPQLEWLQLTPAQYAAVLALGTASGAERTCGMWGPGGGSAGTSSDAFSSLGSPQGAAAWYCGPRKRSMTAARQLTCVRHFSNAGMSSLISTGACPLVTKMCISHVAAAAGASRAPLWHHASGAALWCATQPHPVHTDPKSSPWAGGAVYQGGFFFGLELARRHDMDMAQPSAAGVGELRLCLAAYEALPPGLRGRMRQHAFASVDALVSVKCAARDLGALTCRLTPGAPLPVRDWWSHDFSFAAKAVTAVVLPLAGSSPTRAEAWKAYMTTTAHGSFLACELTLQPRPPPGAAAPQPVAPAAGSDADTDGRDPDWTPNKAPAWRSGGSGAEGMEVDGGEGQEVELGLEAGPFRAVLLDLLRRDREAEIQGSDDDDEELVQEQ